MHLRLLFRLLMPLFGSLSLIFLLLFNASAQNSSADRSIYFVVLDDAPLPRYEGDIPGFPATRPQATGQDKFDADIPAARLYSSYLTARRDSFAASARHQYDIDLDIVAEFQATFNGFALMLTAEEAAVLSQHPAVTAVEKEKIYEPLTDAGPEWVNADAVWNGSIGFTATRGAGVVIGIMDTGIDPWNPSFADISGDGYDHTNPLGSGNYLGVCDPNNTSPPAGIVAYDPTFPCNDKLIGVWGFTGSDASPRDTHGHGSHVAATAAGNVISASISTPDGPYTATIMGVAPQANIIVFDVCRDKPAGCPALPQQLAWEQILLDGIVDVVNYSIGSPSPTFDVWNNVAAEAWLSLREAGIFVATAAGNWGPSGSTIGAPADLPWITAVGASTHNRAFSATLTLTNTLGENLELSGLSRHGGAVITSVVFAADYTTQADYGSSYTAADVPRCSPGIFPAGTFEGQIVVCQRDGYYSRRSKGQTVSAGGGSGLILVQPEFDAGGIGALSADQHVIPGVHITYDSFQQLIAFSDAAGGNISGTISVSQPTFYTAFGDQITRFSSRGPNSTFKNILTPAIAAPGESIFSAHKQVGGDGGTSYRLMSGTSMASPQVAGAGALLLALHPDWTPQEIASALATSARPSGIDTNGVDPATPFLQGSGLLDIGAAAAAGLVLDIPADDFRALNPAVEGRPAESLNFPSVVNGFCQRTCTWSRSFRNATTQTVTWTVQATVPLTVSTIVSPSMFTLAPDETISVNVTLDATGYPYASDWLFGEIIMQPAQPGISQTRLPLAAYPVDFQNQIYFPLVYNQQN